MEVAIPIRATIWVTCEIAIWETVRNFIDLAQAACTKSIVPATLMQALSRLDRRWTRHRKSSVSIQYLQHKLLSPCSTSRSSMACRSSRHAQHRKLCNQSRAWKVSSTIRSGHHSKTSQSCSHRRLSPSSSNSSCQPHRNNTQCSTWAKIQPILACLLWVTVASTMSLRISTKQQGTYCSDQCSTQSNRTSSSIHWARRPLFSKITSTASSTTEVMECANSTIRSRSNRLRRKKAKNRWRAPWYRVWMWS